MRACILFREKFEDTFFVFRDSMISRFFDVLRASKISVARPLKYVKFLMFRDCTKDKQNTSVNGDIKSNGVNLKVYDTVSIKYIVDQ